MNEQQIPSEAMVRGALDEIISNEDHPALNWAVSYAKAGLVMSGEVLRVQCLYVLNNIQYWKGGKAKRGKRDT